MKCVIESAQSQKVEVFVDEYARAILKAGFILERLDEDGDAKILIELDSVEDLEKLANAVENDIVFHQQRFDNGTYPVLTIYDDYME